MTATPDIIVIADRAVSCTPFRKYFPNIHTAACIIILFEIIKPVTYNIICLYLVYIKYTLCFLTDKNYTHDAYIITITTLRARNIRIRCCCKSDCRIAAVRLRSAIEPQTSFGGGGGVFPIVRAAAE